MRTDGKIGILRHGELEQLPLGRHAVRNKLAQSRLVELLRGDQSFLDGMKRSKSLVEPSQAGWR